MNPVLRRKTKHSSKLSREVRHACKTSLFLLDRKASVCYSFSARRFGVMLWKMCNVLLFKGVIAAP